MKTLLFVDDEPRILQGLQRQLHNMRHEWNMSFASSGAEALKLMAANPAEVIVTDMMMPGMDGAQLLTEVLKRHPNTVRIVLSGHADRETVLRLVGPAHQYLSKPCDVDELRNAILRAFTMRDLLSNEQLKQLATRTRALPALPALHAQITEELLKEEPSMERIGNIIAKDIGMATKILQLVNSAFFGVSQPISNTHEAVMYLGLATVRALVLSLHLFSHYDQKNIKGFSINALARHSWIVSVFARNIAEAEHCDPRIGDQCFLTGLLHDVGQLIVADNLPDDYARVIDASRDQNLSLSEAEQAAFGATHAEVGAYLLGLWGLPNPIVEAVALHHRPAGAASKTFSPVIATHVANGLAHNVANTSTEWPGSHIDMACLSKLGLEGRLETWQAQCAMSLQ